MESRNLFFSMMRDNLKKRIPFIVLGILVFFYLFPVTAAMNLSKAMNLNYTKLGMNQTFVINDALSKTFLNDDLISIITCILAVTLAIQGFSYLFSKSKVDFYHALPVKREILFFTVFLNGIIVYAAAYVLSLVLSMVIAGGYGVLTIDIILHIWKALFLHTAYFLIIYSTVVLAMMLTGNLITAVLGSMVFLFYVPFLYEVIRACFGKFFFTYYEEFWASHLRNKLSPIFSYKNLFTYQVTDTGAAVILKIVLIIVAAGVLTISALLLYKRYPSEAAGRSISFPVFKRVIKYFLMVPITLGCGVFFASVNGYGKIFGIWYIFGVLIGLLLSHVIIEMIYEFDIKAGIYNRKQIIIPAIAAASIICVFQFDLFGYDTLPKKDKIESVGIVLPDSNWLGGTNPYKKDKNGNIYYYRGESFIFDHMIYTDMDVIYPFLEMVLEDVREPEADYFLVEYRITGGKKIRRRYPFAEDKYKDTMQILFESREFKEGMYPIYSCPDEELADMSISFVNVDEENPMDDRQEPSIFVSLGEEEEKELIRTYKEELYQLKYEDAYLRNAIGKLGFQPQGQKYTMYAYIYPGFEKTLRMIEPYTKGIE